MAFDAFLKLDGIEGGSQDAFHKGEIEVLSFSWGDTVQNARNAANNAGQGAGRGSRGLNFTFVKNYDKASPMLFLKACQGSTIATGVLSCRKAGSDQTRDAAAQEFLKFTLSDILITSIVDGGQSQTDPGPMDQITLNFLKYELTYIPDSGDPTTASCGADFSK
jgi:type VI secretion system secreted protein Hcp